MYCIESNPRRQCPQNNPTREPSELRHAREGELRPIIKVSNGDEAFPRRGSRPDRRDEDLVVERRRPSHGVRGQRVAGPGQGVPGLPEEGLLVKILALLLFRLFRNPTEPRLLVGLAAGVPYYIAYEPI